MLNVLVVDDEQKDRFAIRRALTAAGVRHRLSEAASGEQGLRMLREEAVAPTRRLVLLDMEMPDMHGLDFLRALRADPHLVRTPVLVLTGHEREEHRRRAHDMNCAGYFAKPFEYSKLTELARTIGDYWAQGYFAKEN